MAYFAVNRIAWRAAFMDTDLRPSIKTSEPLIPSLSDEEPTEMPVVGQRIVLELSARFI